jgi:hypothetical protein
MHKILIGCDDRMVLIMDRSRNCFIPTKNVAGQERAEWLSDGHTR